MKVNAFQKNQFFRKRIFLSFDSGQYVLHYFSIVYFCKPILKGGVIFLTPICQFAGMQALAELTRVLIIEFCTFIFWYYAVVE